jgi:hypothetical protein
LVRTGGDERVYGSGEPVTIAGTAQELVLALYGRRDAAQVEYSGPPEAVERVRTASFGI